MTDNKDTTREQDLARLDALVERWANYIIQGRDGADAEGTAASWQNLDMYTRQRDALRKQEAERA